MATGDILAASVNSDGWTIDITVEGQGVGGSYDFNLGTNNDPSAAFVEVNATEPGYTNTGATTTLSKTVYGTTSLRKPYPNEATNQEVVSGSDVILTIALSDFIGADATAVTIDISANWYTDTVGNNLTTGLSVTNNSTATYSKTLANWSSPGHNLIVDALELKAVAFHRSATGGQPVKCVKFTVTDESAHSITKTIVTPTATEETNTGVYVIEYIANFNSGELSALDAEENLSCDFIAYPVMGNAAATLDTSDAVHTDIDWRYKTQLNYYDPLEAYTKVHAVVDPISGNDTTGVASATKATAVSNPFLTIFTAIREIRDINNAAGRNNASNGTVWLVDGSYDWVGGNVFTPTDGLEKVWLHILPLTGDKTTVSATPNTTSDNRRTTSKYIKVSDISFTRPGAQYFFRSDVTDSELWVDDCDIDASGNDYQFWQLNFANNSITNTDFLITSTINMHPGLLRNCNITGEGNLGYASTMIGNNCDCGVADTAHTITDSTASDNTIDGAIIAFNKFMDQQNTIIQVGNYSITHGIAIIQNILERSVQGTGTYPAILFYAEESGTPTASAQNVLRWYNTTAGQRENMAYDAAGTGTITPDFLYWSERGNIDLYRAYKSDLFTPANANRDSNWSVGFQVGGYGNTMQTSSFVLEFAGLYGSIEAGVTWDYTDDASITGTGLGNGDYHLGSSSDALSRMTAATKALPYDLDGVAREDSGAGGAFELVEETVLVTGDNQPIITSGGSVIQTTFATGDNQPVITGGGSAIQTMLVTGDNTPIILSGGSVESSGGLDDLDNAVVLGSYTTVDKVTLATFTG